MKVNQTFVREKIQELEEKVKSFKTTQEFLDFITAMSRFHKYSFHNQILILFQKPDAKHVAGFRTWKKLGRYVKRGEKGIQILVPVPYTKEDDEGDEVEKVWFKTGFVFDVSQTDGKPLPDIALDVKDCKESLYFLCLDLAEKYELKVDVVSDLKPYGVSKGGKILLRQDSNLTSMAVVLLHELSHELLHQSDDAEDVDRETMELEAETVAYVVCSHLGVDVPSDKYLATWQNKHRIIDSLKRISECSGKLIEELEEISNCEKVNEMMS